MSSLLNLKPDFPIFTAHPELVYLDNAATVHKPHAVIAAEQEFYKEHYASVHRGVYPLAEAATESYEAVRAQLAAYNNAASSSEIVFTQNATAALNLAAWIEQSRLELGDEVLLSAAEHHSNLLPWQRWACIRGAKLVWVELDREYRFDMADFRRKLSSKTKIVAVASVSNVLGDARPLCDIITAAHAVGARVVVDAAQQPAFTPLDVQALDVDYAAFSGHKLYGPTGTGWLYAKKEFLVSAEPFMVGGGTIKRVTRASTLWHDTPWKFEAGTYNIAGAVGLGAALTYLQQQGFAKLAAHYATLTELALKKLPGIAGLKLYGPPTGEQRAGIFSFTLDKLHSHDLCALAGERGVSLRGGHHCAEPLMTTLGVKELTRASLGIYNTAEDVDRLVAALEYAKEKLS